MWGGEPVITLLGIQLHGLDFQNTFCQAIPRCFLSGNTAAAGNTVQWSFCDTKWDQDANYHFSLQKYSSIHSCKKRF